MTEGVENIHKIYYNVIKVYSFFIFDTQVSQGGISI